ncbi:hypothetical protein AC739_15590 [Planococcus glaciei]|uniref:hypothetical protein n=1 Tax=Planococcus glaciei TaxID=459472 RepID=UPI00069D2FAD|nr:hypothetical protein [Planococcus glaciei]KOF09265.1 hypothetical protein AC739_15590 [Planococcus glaciei]
MPKINILGKKKRITPGELRKTRGRLTNVNVTNKQLVEGADRQWKRYNDLDFQREEFEERLEKVFGHK